MADLMKMQSRNDIVSSVSDFHTKNIKDRYCVVIPVYNHERTVAEVAKQALKLNLPMASITQWMQFP
jgi:siroheme synthase (precorrin-2 oxidase/ferrochelatase)